jgi:hypothetical protein
VACPAPAPISHASSTPGMNLDDVDIDSIVNGLAELHLPAGTGGQ